MYFGIYADFEADNENDSSSMGSKTSNIYKQKPVSNGYEMVSELEDALKSDYYKPPLGYDNVDWFVDEIIKFKKEKTFFLEKTKEDINMTEQNEEDFKNYNICRFCAKNIESDKDRNYCHPTGKYRGPAHSKCNVNVTQKQSIFFHLHFIISVIMTGICFIAN